MNTCVLTFDPDGTGSCLYNELIDLQSIGLLEVTRATEIEFNPLRQLWEVKATSSEVLFAHPSRNVCLAWEQQHLNR